MLKTAVGRETIGDRYQGRSGGGSRRAFDIGPFMLSLMNLMADKDHLALIHQGVDVWNEWREKRPEVRPDLIEANLHAMNLRGADLRYANLSWAYLFGADLRGADLTNAIGLTRKQVESAITDVTTALPDDLKVFG